MVLQHITKRAGYLFVASQAIAQREGKMNKSVPAKFIEI